jgi:WD40 repeat protein
MPVVSAPILFGDPQLHTDGDLVALAFTAGGSLWSVEDPGVIRHWDADSGRQLGYQQLSEMETLWGFSDDGRLVAAASNDLAVWDAVSGHLRAALPQPAWVTALGFGPDPTRVATGHDDGRVCLWDTAANTLVRTFTALQRPVSAVAFSPEGQRLAFASEGKTIVIARVGDGETLQVLTGHTDRIPQIVWHPDGRWLISAGWDGTARVWDAATGQVVRLLNTHERQVTALALSPDGRLLATADADGVIHVWRCPQFERIHVLPTSAEEIRCLAFSADGKRLACGADRRAQLWDIERGEPLAGASDRPQTATSLAVGPGGSWLVSNGGGRACAVWDTATRQPLRTLTDREAVAAVTVSPDGRWIAGATGLSVHLWDARTGRFHATLDDHEEPITGLAFSPDSQTLAAASDAGLGVWLWDVPEAEPRLLIPDALDGCTIHTLAFFPDGRRLAVGGIDWLATSGSDGAISIWDLEERCEVATFGTGTTALALHPDGDRLLSATLDHALILWDVAAEDEVAEWDGHEATVNAVAFSPDGQRAVSGADDRTLRLWDVATGAALAEWEMESQVKALAVSPDGRRVFTGHANTTVCQVNLGRR